MPPGWLNRLLARTFAAESHRLLGVLHGKRSTGFQRGASLLALLRRDEGAIAARQRPPDIPPDPFNPRAGTWPGESAVATVDSMASLSLSPSVARHEQEEVYP
jgi:hypothetical protein